MSAQRPARIDRATAEQLLRGGPVGAQAAPEDLVDLFAAAAAPASARELAGEPAALAAFRAARLGPVHQPRRRQMIKSTLAKLFTVKAAAALAAATAAGGVALAASSGTLPNPLAGGGAEDTKPTAAHATARPAPDASHGERGNASPSPSLVGLCHAYTAGAANNPGKALENPAFTALITAAGGKDQVAGYCVKILAAAPGASATAKSGKEAAGGATSAPGVARTGAPTADHPTGPPSPRPTR